MQELQHTTQHTHTQRPHTNTHIQPAHALQTHVRQTPSAIQSADTMLDSSRVVDKSFEDLLLSRSLYRPAEKPAHAYMAPIPATPPPAPAHYNHPSPSPAAPSPSLSPSSSFTRNAYIEMLERQRREKNEDIRQTARHISESKRAPSDGHGQEYERGTSVFDQSYTHTPVRSKETQHHVFETSFTPTSGQYVHTPPAHHSDVLDTSVTSTSHTSETTSSRFLRIHNAEKSLHAVKDTELLEIYADIGRLTGRLETRLRHSHPASGYASGSYTSVNNSFNSSLYDTPERARSRGNSWKK
ncbi:hypothetical protein EON63_12675 [archaeon]|nr:MAG: hypothetical protein EON63_12675 [archaeon]